jgi:1-pyrroline-5-carboxylate dehydrogenase
MSNGFYKIPVPVNEPVRSYSPDSTEKINLKNQLKEMKSKVADIAMFIDGKEVRTGKTIDIKPPHEHKHLLAKCHRGDSGHVNDAINAALKAKKNWENLSWEHRASIFLRAADLVAGPYRDKINAATMLGQSKNVFQAEIDAACEFTDFLRFNAYYMEEIYRQQPISSPGIWNRVEQRPLEGFVYAITPFNFTAIAGNLPASAALMSNTVVWKPSDSQVYSADVVMEIFRKAGLPDGVINLIYTEPVETSNIVFSHPDFAGIHFTGSTDVFRHIWKTVGNNIGNYKSYPRIVGETGGKDFVMAHSSADPKVLATAISRGAFEYQGQKCSAASRAYIPDNLWPEVKKLIQEDVASFKIGSTENFSNFINAVIHEGSFNKLAGYIDRAKNDKDVEIIAGGTYDKSEGYFIHPTVIHTKNPKYATMCEELFGPVVTIYVYEAKKYEETLKLLDETSTYALTGCIIAQDRYAIEKATKMLTHSAGNFYINDKPTGAVVGQQPFGGGRASGTNDKAGSMLNLLRWVSPRTIKETLVPPTDYRYPFLSQE